MSENSETDAEEKQAVARVAPLISLIANIPGAGGGGGPAAGEAAAGCFQSSRKRKKKENKKQHKHVRVSAVLKKPRDEAM